MVWPPQGPPARAPGEGHRRDGADAGDGTFGPDASNARRPWRRSLQRVLSDRPRARRLGIQQLYPEQQRVIEAVPAGGARRAAVGAGNRLLPDSVHEPVVLISPLLALLRPAREAGQALHVRTALRGKHRREALERIERLVARDHPGP